MRILEQALYTVLFSQVVLGWIRPSEPATAKQQSRMAAANAKEAPSQYTVQFKESKVPFEELIKPHRSILNSDENKILKEYPPLYAFIAQIRDEAVLAKIKTLASISDVSKPRRMRVKAANMTSQRIWPQFWNLDYLDGPDDSYVWKNNTRSRVVAYVIDTGVNAHLQFGRRVILNETVVRGTTAADLFGHGTHVAGTIAGYGPGVAKKTRIASIKVFGDDGWGSDIDVVNGILRAIIHHNSRRARDPMSASVINLSLGGEPSDFLDNAVRYAISNNITVAIAAGNNGTDACLESPGRVRVALTVAASNYANELAIWSSRGSCVDLIAPGEGITSCDASTTNGFVTYGGTSMAAPHVAGAAALLLEKNPTLTPAQVATELKKIALKNAVRLPYMNYGYNGGDFKTGTPLDKATPNLFLQVPKIE